VLGGIGTSGLFSGAWKSRQCSEQPQENHMPYLQYIDYQLIVNHTHAIPVRFRYTFI